MKIVSITSCSLLLITAILADYYSFDGRNNNLEHVAWGASDRKFQRLEHEYDSLSYDDKKGEIDASSPNPRVISNILGQMPNRGSIHYAKYAPLSGISWSWGVLLAQDICRQEWNLSDSEYSGIEIPSCDWYLDPKCTNNVEMPFYRVQYEHETINATKTIRTPINTITSWIDANWLYGDSYNKSLRIRTFTDGQIITDPFTTNTADELVSYILDQETSFEDNVLWDHYNQSLNANLSTAGLHAGISGGSTSRSCPFMSFESTHTHEPKLPNIYPLNAMKTLFGWEHNRIAQELKDEYNWNDDDLLYQEARARNIALIQKITYTEYIPLLLAYPFTVFVKEYNNSWDASATTLFCSIALRYAHSSSPTKIPFAGFHDEDGIAQYGEVVEEEVASVSLRDSFAHPCVGVDKIGSDKYIESMIAGLSLEPEHEVGTEMAEDMRSWVPVDALKGITATSRQQTKWWDMFAIDILRARDFGVPSYNNLREMFGLTTVSKWSDLTNNSYYLSTLPLIYKDIDQLDAYVGALIENPEATYPNSGNGSAHLGPLLAAISRDQYYRLIANDRLFYKWNDTLNDFVKGVTLSQVIMRNTQLRNLTTDLMTANAKAYYASSISTNITDIDSLNEAFLFNELYHLRWNIKDIEAGIEDLTNYIEFEIELTIGSAMDGYLAIGFGDNEYMQQKDIVKCAFSRYDNVSSFMIMDAWSAEWFPDMDLKWEQQGATNDVYDESGMFIDDKVICRFKRPLIATDAWDWAIEPGLMYFIASFQVDCGTECKHDTNHRTPGRVDWYAGTFNIIKQEGLDIVRLYHGLTMIGLFGFAYPTSAVVARYFKHNPWWKYFHQQLASLGLMTSLTSAYFAVATNELRRISMHGILGTICVVLLCMQVVGGYCVSYWLDYYKRNIWYTRIHYNHLAFAILLITLSPITIWYGWNRLRPYDALTPLLYLPTWYIYPVFVVIGSSLYSRFYPRWSKNSEYVVFQSNYHVFTWDEIGEKISAGAAWIVIDKYVFDVTRWMETHPGGRKILLDHVGIDCTKLFYGIEAVDETHGGNKYTHSEWAKKQMTHMIVGEVPPITQIKPETAFQRNRLPSVIKKENSITPQIAQSPSFDRNFSKYASLMDVTKTKANDEAETKQKEEDEAIDNEPLDAFMQDEEINELIVLIDQELGSDEDLTSDEDTDREERKENDTKSDIMIRRQQTRKILMRHQEKKATAMDLVRKSTKLQESKRFRAIKILSKTKMTPADCIRPIICLEFDFDALQLMTCGSYILLHNVENEMVSRAYTPIHPAFILCDEEKPFAIQIEDNKNKKYRNHGTASKTADHPEKRLFLLIRLYKKGRMSYIINRMNINATMRFTGPFERQPLLAPLDFGFGKRCWRRIVLLAGGTGITPMLNVLYHHLTHGTSKCKVILIWYNRNLSDLCCCDHLKYFKSKYGNRFWCDFIFSAAQDIDVEIKSKLTEWARVYEYKWDKQQALAMIKTFLKDGKPASVDSNVMDVDIVSEDMETDASQNNTEQQKIEMIKSEPEVQILKQLNPFDRIMMSGPKPFVEQYLKWLEEAKDLQAQNIGKQVICLD